MIATNPPGRRKETMYLPKVEAPPHVALAVNPGYCRLLVRSKDLEYQIFPFSLPEDTTSRSLYEQMLYPRAQTSHRKLICMVLLYANPISLLKDLHMIIDLCGCMGPLKPHSSIPVKPLFTEYKWINLAILNNSTLCWSTYGQDFVIRFPKKISEGGTQPWEIPVQPRGRWKPQPQHWPIWVA